LVVVFDLDGVVYLGETPIPRAIPALNTLEAAGHSLYFLTNNSTRSRASYASRLARMGYYCPPERVMTSAYATALYLAGEGAAGKSVLVVGEEGLAEEMRAVGMRVLAEDDPAPADYVVAGLDRGLTYARLRRAHDEITRNGARFVATNRDATYPMESGEIPGGGAIVAPIEYSTGVRGITIGKPEPHTWLRILALAGAEPAEALMVGDRPETDILGARRLGLHTALVLTGVTSAAEAEHLPAEQRPEFVLPDLSALPDLAAALEQERP
jgi:phosphoglycolate/pyridoxal phosphate phosphatase family enzyme